MGLYSGEERLIDNIIAAYTDFKGSSKDDGTKLSRSPSHPPAGETMRRSWRESFTRQLLKAGRAIQEPEPLQTECDCPLF